MASLNKVLLIGNVGRDPETSYTPGGMAITRLSLATTDKYKDKNTGELRENTEWHRLVAFGKTAETISKYVSKGQSLYVEGRLKTSSYEKDGITRYNTDIIIDTFQFLGQKPQGNQNSGHNQSGKPQGGYQSGGNGYNQPQQPDDQGYMQPPDDNIPF